MNQRRFFGNDFFYKKFAYSASVKVRNQRILGLNIGFGRSPTSVFEFGLKKSDSKNCELVPTRPACGGCKCEKFFLQKITVRFKLNLKTDGLICKMIFKFGKHVERLHRTRKQCRCIYICLFCSAKYWLGTPKPLNCIRWMQAWRLQMRKFMALTHCQPLVNNFFQSKKKIAMIKDEHYGKM